MEIVNRRYILWAKKHGLTPEQMLEKDKQDWPGGCMTGYNLWIQERVRALCIFHGVTPYDLRAVGMHLKQDDRHVFDNWLEASV